MNPSEPEQPDLSAFFDPIIPPATDGELDQAENFAHTYIAKGSARLNGVNYSESTELPLTVRANLARVQAKYADRFDISTDNILAEYAKAAFFDPRDLFHADGRLRQVHELDNQVSAAIASLSVTQVGGSVDGWVENVQYRFADKLKALDSLSKQLGLFTDNVKIEHSGEIATPDTDNERARRIAFMLEEVIRARIAKNSEEDSK